MKSGHLVSALQWTMGHFLLGPSVSPMREVALIIVRAPSFSGILNLIIHSLNRKGPGKACDHLPFQRSLSQGLLKPLVHSLHLLEIGWL